MKYKLPQNKIISKFMEKLGLNKTYSSVPLMHIESILRASVQDGFKGKIKNIAQHSEYHRTTIAHFLNNGKWDESKLEKSMKIEVLKTIVSKSEETGLPIIIIIDYTVCSKRKPSSRAKAPIEESVLNIL